MENNERDRKLEQWLDEALSEYSAAEPRLGLEQRVLNRVRGEEKTRAQRWSFWKWMPAFAAIAAAAIIGVAIRPLTLQKSAPVQMSARLEPAVSPKRSEEIAAKDGAAAAPAKKALVTREVDAEMRREAKSTGGVSTRRADAAKIELGDARTSHAFKADGNAAETKILAAPAAPPQLPVTGRNYQSVVIDQPASVAGGSKSGLVATQTVEVTSAQPAVQTVQGASLNQQHKPSETLLMAPAGMDAKVASENAPTGIVGVEPVKVAKETAALKRMKKDEKERERAAQQQAGDAAFAGAFGTVVRTEIKQLPAGPMQFPTPSPLSEQEKLVLAAAKKLKDAPKQDAQGGAIAPVEIKDVQIAPLEAPKK
jgi:hypothetical protein